LAYPVQSVTWDGEKIRRRPAAEISQSLELMQQCGVHEVMLSGYHLEEESDFDVDAETRRLGDELEQRGMRAAQHHGLCATFGPLASPQHEAVDHLRRCVDFTANLGDTTLVLHTGRVTGRLAGVEAFNDAFEAECAQHGSRRMMEVCAENLRIAGEHARECGVLIALENLDRFEPLGNMKELPELVALTNSPAVGYCLDTGHAHCAGSDILQWIKIMGDKLFTTHVHDNHGPSAEVLGSTGLVSATGIDEHLPPGFGTIPWTDVITALWGTGYSHSLTFESGPWPGLDAQEGLRSAIRYWRACEFLAGKADEPYE
jgi:sugar phosphate isomerase/epimerase